MELRSAAIAVSERSTARRECRAEESLSRSASTRVRIMAGERHGVERVCGLR